MKTFIFPGLGPSICNYECRRLGGVLFLFFPVHFLYISKFFFLVLYGN